MAAFNQSLISHGYSFIHFLNPKTGRRVDAFVVHNGDHLTVCNPRVGIVLPLLRNLVNAYSEQNVTKQMIFESEVQKT